MDPVEKHEDGWGFWNETWSDWYGGYETETKAREALEDYCKHCL